LKRETPLIFDSSWVKEAGTASGLVNNSGHYGVSKSNSFEYSLLR
jgi:hypothetical protein